MRHENRERLLAASAQQVNLTAELAVGREVGHEEGKGNGRRCGKGDEGDSPDGRAGNPPHAQPAGGTGTEDVRGLRGR